MKINEITIRGEKQEGSELAQSTDLIQLRHSYRVGGNTRGASENHKVKLDDDNIIELVFEDTTTWFCSPNTIEEVFPEAAIKSRSGNGSFEIPTVLRSDDTERGVVSDVIVKVINIFSRKKISTKVKELAADLEKKQLENQSGLYRIDRNFQLQKFTAEKTENPYLLFLHGTASSTKGSFGDLANTELWNQIQKTYGVNVLAFQHESLTKSPLQNALELVVALPKNATLHMISQSRGGLVGDILSRFFNSNENNRGFSENEINQLRKSKRKDDLDKIDELLRIAQTKKIVVKKFIRVACPAGGTTLASKRLDNFFNITFNLIGFGTGLAANPIYAAFKNLIVSVIDSKNKVDVLPGLEAMNPDSPFIELLNNPVSEVSLDNSIAIISGNCNVKINLKALLIIASKLFYRQDNDLIVNTRSMYQSGKREEGKLIQYFFDEGAEVDHFHYFLNKRTNEALALALKAPEDALIPTFTQLQQSSVEELERNALLKLDGGQVFRNTVTGTKPIVVLLPGIMGSNLAQNGDLVWIKYGQFITGKLSKLNINSPNINAPSLIRTSYKSIVDHLSETYDVVTFPYDWRLQLRTRAKLFDTKIKELLKYNQPIKIIGHSMGGVLVRDFIVNHKQTWDTLNASAGFKLIFLGAPLGGSFRIPSVLFGYDSLITKLAKIDLFHTKKELLGVFSKLPGLLSLLPLTTEPENDFSKSDTWSKMREAFGQGDWPLPQSADLTEFKAYRDSALTTEIDYTNISYIAGRDKSTPCGYRIDEVNGSKELVFLCTAEGDQSVTWESGIPSKMIQNNSVYYVNVIHGALANEPEIFSGITEILANGSTNLLSKTRPIVRGDQKVFRSPELNDFDLSPDGIENTILGLAPRAKSKVSERPLRLSVNNGDLKYATYPVMAGHFNDDGILFAEKAINRYLKGALSERHQLGLYPGLIGTNEVLLSMEQDFKGAVIIGLGKLGELTAFQLTKSVEQGVSKYLIQLNSKSFPGTVQAGLSSLIIGCGYGGLTIEESVNAIALGVSNANHKIKKLYGDRARLIEFVEFVEQNKSKALNCFYALHKIEKNTNQSVHAVMDKKKIIETPGAVQSQSVDGTVGWWTRITVKQEDASDESKPENLLFTISTGGAREEQRLLFGSKRIIEQLIKEISTDNQWSARKAKTIFELLIPNDFKDQVKKQNNIVWILDKQTASYPWELLQDGIQDAKPLSVNAGMIRQLITPDYRVKINSVNNKKALVVGDPDLKGFVNQLPGAVKEGQLVSSILSSKGFDAPPLIRESSGKILEALLCEDYKIIHLAGHGEFNPKDPDSSGMIIGNGVFLSTRVIKQMSTVPELVFVNCCFLGKTSGADEKFYQDRYKLAANIGTQLIENGVKVVIAAGWAVDDESALMFTEVFYNSMFDGYNFGESIKKARQAVYSKDGDNKNTWGAYQCYGDQYYKFREEGHSPTAKEYHFLTTEEALMELSNLHSEIETGNSVKDDYLTRIHSISKSVDQADVRSAEITEKEAMVFADLHEYELAIAKFGSLEVSNKSLSFLAMERYCSIRAKKCVADFVHSPKKLKSSLKTIEQVVEDLNSLLRLGQTAGRLGVMGSTFKRKSILLSNKVQKVKAYEEMAYYYYKAYSIPENPYSANALANWLEAEYLLVLLGKRKWGSTIKISKKDSYSLPQSVVAAVSDLRRLKSSLSNRGLDKIDYRDLVSIATIGLCQHVLSPTASSAKDLSTLYKKIWDRSGSQGKKLAEIEHFDFLIDALSQISKTKQVKKSIEYLKKQLVENIDG
jgi:CHAT domain-containing protein